MYSITRKLDGKYLCYLMYQDGHETWTVDTHTKAVHDMIEGAKVWNGSDITVNDIEFYEEKPIHTVTVEKVAPPNLPHPYKTRCGGPVVHSIYEPNGLPSKYCVVVPFLTKEDAENFKDWLEQIDKLVKN